MQAWHGGTEALVEQPRSMVGALLMTQEAARDDGRWALYAPPGLFGSFPLWLRRATFPTADGEKPEELSFIPLTDEETSHRCEVARPPKALRRDAQRLHARCLRLDADIRKFQRVTGVLLYSVLLQPAAAFCHILLYPTGFCYILQ